jgi:hypothetical protein
LFQYGLGEALRATTGQAVVYQPRLRKAHDLALPAVLRRELPLASVAQLAAVGVRSEQAGGRLRRVAQGLRRSPAPFVERLPTVFDPAVFEVRAPALVQGYFQDERYLTYGGADPDEWISLEDASVLFDELQVVRPATIVSFRRGDYNDFGFTLPLEFYERALDELCARAAVETCIVIGDDRDFVKMAVTYFAPRAPRIVDGLSHRVDPASQLALIAACDHCIIPNSSFAWWGAWLGDRRHGSEDRVVIVPERWSEHGNPTRGGWTALPAR